MDHRPDGPAGIPVLGADSRAAADDAAAIGAPPIVDAFVERFEVPPARDGALSGTSFAVKDLFDVAGRLTGCGNPDFRATRAPARHHAAAVDALLDAGARLVGKTRTDELAYSLVGVNAHEGAPLNPAAPQRLTGGSSSGSAAAVAAREVDFALGTDTAGSVRVPAAWCGLLGLRPTHARVSVVGVTPLAPSFDTVGWFARSGSLLRSVGRVLLGSRRDDAAGTVRSSIEFTSDAALDALAEPAPFSLMAPLVERIDALDLAVDLERAVTSLRVLQGREAWVSHGAWISAVRPRLGPGVAERFEAGRSQTDATVSAAERVRDAVRARLDSLLPPGRLLVMPTVPCPAAPRHASVEDLERVRARLLPLTVLASLSGRPQLSLPLRSVDGAPAGMSLLGWRGADEILLDIAAELIP